MFDNLVVVYFFGPPCSSFYWCMVRYSSDEHWNFTRLQNHCNIM